jgi:hypothetical protein
MRIKSRVITAGVQMSVDLLASETVVLEGAANHKALGGALTLTNRRLIFKSHGLNLGLEGGRVIDLREIKSIVPAWTKLLGIPIVPNSIEVRTQAGVYSFAIGNRMNWITRIMEQKNSPSR